METTTIRSSRLTCTMDPNITDASQYVACLGSVIAKLDLKSIDRIAERLFEAYCRDRTIFILGNGGSAALASHFACDLGKGVTFNNGSKRMRALSLADNIPLMTAWANDVSYECIFAEQLRNFVAAGDILFAISGSGNSANVLCGLEVARAAGATTLGITGFEGGKMRALCDVCLVVPSDNMQMIEDLNTVATHAVSTIIHSLVNAHCPRNSVQVEAA
jgi:D-sedoheptulose 7-phosphate isomerase